MSLKRFMQNEDSHEFKPILAEIEDAPQSPLGSLVFWTVVVFMVIAGCWLVFGKVDVVVSTRGIVIPVGEVKVIQPLDTGVISSILVKEGDFVAQGQVLMEIDPSATEPALASSTVNLSNIQLEIERLQALANNGDFKPDPSRYAAEAITTQVDTYRSMLDGLKNQLKIKDEELISTSEQIRTAEDEKRQNELLLASSREREQRLRQVIDIIAQDEYVKEKNLLESYKTELSKLAHQIEELKSKRKQLDEEIGYIKEKFKSDNLKELSEKQKQANQLQSEVDQITFRNTKQKIVASVNGHVDKITMHTVGGVVTPAQQLITITPDDVPLVIKATVLNNDIGFVKEGMDVRIKIDTFSFQKYGLLQGKVINVARSSTMDEKLGPVYEVFINPLETKLMVEGREERISAGMSLSGEIKVGKRRIIEFFIYPLIKYLDEGISVR